MILFVAALVMPALAMFGPRWTLQTTGVTARLRGVSAVNERVAWASGSGATVLRTTDGGATWKKLSVTTETLDFRDIDAIDPQTAYVLSIGKGAASRIYKTTDAGATWTMQFKSDDHKERGERRLELRRLAGVGRVFRDQGTCQDPGDDRRPSVPKLVHGHGRRHAQAGREGRRPQGDRQGGRGHGDHPTRGADPGLTSSFMSGT